MKLKLFDYIFIGVSAAILLAGIIHVTISFIDLLIHQMETSFPPETAFMLFIPYAFVVIILMAVWLILRQVRKKKEKSSK